MPTRILLRLFLLAGLAAPWCAFALGVGPLEVRSALNQQFEAEIPLITSNPAELIGLTAQIPRQQDFDRAGIERLQFFSKLRFAVETPAGGPNVIKIRSTEPIREPNFNLLVEVTWPRGRLFREFPVHLDPELYAHRREPPPPPLVIPPLAEAPPIVAAPPAPALPPAPPVSFEGASFYGPVRTGETLIGIANQVRPSTTISLPQMMAILVAGNPEAFIDGNPSRLRVDSVLRVPSPQALGMPGVPTPSPTPDLASLPARELPPEYPGFTLEPTVPPAPPESLEPVASIPEPPVLVAEPEPVLPPPLPVEPLPEIVPEASLPSVVEATPAPPVEDVSTTAEPPVVPVESPPTVAPIPVTPPPPPALPEEIDSGWWKNPVVWLAIALILLAVGSILLLPLLRRPARPKPAAKMPEPAAESPPEAGESPAVSTTTRTQVREPRSVRPRPAASGAVAASPGGAAPPLGTVTPQPKPISELLKEIDLGPSEYPLSPAAGGKAPTPVRKMETPRLPDSEPPTASVTRVPTPFSPAPAPQPQTPPVEAAPSELRLSDLDFDFDALGLENTARPSTEFPPLEMQPITPGPRTSLPALDFGFPEPVTEPTPAEPSSSTPAMPIPERSTPPIADRKFEFTDVTQELEPRSREDLLNLDDDLRRFSADALDLGKMEASPGGGDNTADYVETKMDLATAYLDMGDQVGARSLLEEVLKEGDSSQRQRAEELLKKMG
ncbi:MAG: FimV/HubP family polar landmark protein [Candidatus Competibacteraceae bacterium]